jgi:hypothetical protein
MIADISLKYIYFISFGYMPRNGIAVLSGISIFLFYEELTHSVHKGCTN